MHQRLGLGLRGKLEPEDVIQETFLEAHRTFERFESRGKGSFARWLCRLAESSILRQAEWFGAEKRDPRREAVLGSTLFEELRGSSSTPSSLASRTERYERLSAALQDLEDEEREAVLLRFFQGLTIPQIVEQVGQSRSTVKRLLGRATLRLGVALGELEG